MAKIKIKQIKSPIGRNNLQRKILISLGLNKINEIKTKYPKTNTGSTTVGSVPSWVQTEVDKLNS